VRTRDHGDHGSGTTMKSGRGTAPWRTWTSRPRDSKAWEPALVRGAYASPDGKIMGLYLAAKTTGQAVGKRSYNAHYLSANARG
jgi:hypothetical protein